MGILNIANCSTQGNTGGTFCNVEPSYIAYAVVVPKGTVIPASAMVSQAAFASYVQARLYSDSRTTRWQLSPKLVDFKDGTKEPVFEDLDGYQNLTQMPPYVWAYRFANGFAGATKNIHKIWRKYIHQQQNLFSFFFIDANNVWIGQDTKDNAGLGTLTSIDATSIVVNDWKQATPKTGNMYALMIGLADNAQLNANYGSVASTTLTSSFKGLIDVTLTKGVTTTTSTHIYVSGIIGSNTLGKQYGATLAAALTAFVITNKTDGANAFTISAVSYDATNDQYDITGAWGSSAAGDTVEVSLAAPSVMTITPYFAPITTEGDNVYTFTAP